MNLTTSEIRNLIKIARDNPSMAVEDIINAIIEGYSLKTGIKVLLSNIADVFANKPITLRPDPAEILETICIFHRLKPEWIKSKSRQGRLVRVRQQYCLIATLFKHFQGTIAGEIDRDHATAHHSTKNAKKFYQGEQEYMAEVDSIINEFPKYKTTLNDRLADFISGK